jgi:hypothetical protein
VEATTPAYGYYGNLHAAVRLSGRELKISIVNPFFAPCRNQSSSMKFSRGGISGYSLTTSCSGISRRA